MLYVNVLSFHMRLAIASAQALSLSCCNNFCLTKANV